MGEKGRWQMGKGGIEKITGIGMGRDWKRWRKSDHDRCSQRWGSSSHCLAVPSWPAGQAPLARLREGEEKLTNRAGEQEWLHMFSCVCGSKQCGHELKQSRPSSRVVNAVGERRGKEDKRGVLLWEALRLEGQEPHASSFSLESRT